MKRYSPQNQFMQFLLLSLGMAGTVSTQSIMRLSNSPAPVLNYAFATQLGAGIYSVSGRTAYIYRLSVALPVYKSDAKDWFIRLKLPMTLGFFNFKLQDVIDIGFPDHLATLSLVPTLECPIPLARSWWIEPSLGIGNGWDFSTDTSSPIYAAAVRSFAISPLHGFDFRLGNRLVYSGYTTWNMGFVDDFAFLETGLDARRLLGARIGSYDIDWSVFGVSTLYLLSPHLINLNPGPMNAQAEWEVGCTFGTYQPIYFGGLHLPRIGISYRFSSKANAIRLILGDPFPMDSP